jgi:hypothetical protein
VQFPNFLTFDLTAIQRSLQHRSLRLEILQGRLQLGHAQQSPFYAFSSLPLGLEYPESVSELLHCCLLAQLAAPQRAFCLLSTSCRVCVFGGLRMYIVYKDITLLFHHAKTGSHLSDM